MFVYAQEDKLLRVVKKKKKVTQHPLEYPWCLSRCEGERTYMCWPESVPGEQQGGAGAQWADEMDGQLPSLVVGQREASLNVFQGADVLRPSPAGVHALAEHQLVPDVPVVVVVVGEEGVGGGERWSYCSVAAGRLLHNCCKSPGGPNSWDQPHPANWISEKRAAEKQIRLCSTHLSGSWSFLRFF